ncbi:MAG: LysR family transcriptional regulator [Pseudomonadota bacterium]
MKVDALVERTRARNGQIEFADLHAFSLRQLKAVLRVSELQNVTRAAHSLARSQTTITKSIHEVENTLGRTLFERSSTGLTPNIYGETFARRLHSIRRILDRAYQRYESHHNRPRPAHLIPIFTMDLGARRISTLISLNESGDVKVAAEKANLTPSAIYKFLRELESQLDLTVFDRRPNGRLAPSEFGSELVQHLKLIFSELRHALEDLAKIEGLLVGRMIVGTLPSTRPVVVPTAIEAILRRHPQVNVATREASFQRLARMLSSGDIDMIVTGTRPLQDIREFDVQHLCTDRLGLFASAEHPVAKKADVSETDLSQCQWVLPPSSTPAGRLFQSMFQEMDLGSDIISVESNSTMILRSLILDSGFISIASRHQTRAERRNGTIVELDFELADDSWPIGVVLRKEAEPSPIAREFLDDLINSSAQLAP